MYIDSYNLMYRWHIQQSRYTGIQKKNAHKRHADPGEINYIETLYLRKATSKIHICTFILARITGGMSNGQPQGRADTTDPHCIMPLKRISKTSENYGLYHTVIVLPCLLYTVRKCIWDYENLSVVKYYNVSVSVLV